MSTQTPQHPPAHEEPELRPVRLIVGPEDGHYSAVAPDYTIAGRGDTPDAAVANAMDLLCDYLTSCMRDGVSFEQARRPLPFLWRAEIEAKLVAGRLLRSSTRPRRRNVSLPRRPAHC